MNKLAARALMAALCLHFAAANVALGQSAAPAARKAQEYRDFAMVHDGNVANGRALFLSEQRLDCAKCHSIDGSNSKAGPDLFAAGDKFPRSELIQSVLEPSATIAVGYATTIVEMKSGEEVSGIVKDVSADAIELMGADGKLVRIANRDIKAQRGSNVSLMPESLQTALSLQEFTDLIDFLVTLKQPDSALVNNRGMPADIPELARPVRARPFVTNNFRITLSPKQEAEHVRLGLVWFGQVPGMSNLFLAAYQSGKIWLIENNPGGQTITEFADFASELFSDRGPNGLLGLAFHPHFRENRKYYLKHQVFEDNKIGTTVVEKVMAADFRHDSGQPSRRLLKMVGSTQDHTGGCIQFGPDGFLYIGMGDTGPQQDPQGHGQDLNTLLGKMLRIDVDRPADGLPYAIPADNPFRDTPGARPEIWAYGLREPWRFSFDPVTHDLWVGDVGQDRIEEVSIVRRGENLGWNVYEGFEFFSNRYRKEGCAYTFPVFAYKRKYGNSVTGGVVYRGDPKSSFYGVYIFGDYTSHRIFGLTQRNRNLQAIRQIGTLPQGIVEFSADERGEIYVVGYEGMVYRLDFAGAVFE